MTNEDILWFKRQFGDQMQAAVVATPFSVDMLTAIACQETGYLWAVLRRKQLDVGRLLELCVGDTLDADKGRRAFPRTKADLVERPNGARMFDIARRALLDMANFVPGFGFAFANPDKFCHGFGIFQYDLQHFLSDPEYFLERRYTVFEHCVAKCIEELRQAMRRIGWSHKAALDDGEMAAVAIAYNTGGYSADKGLKQGHRNAAGQFYGELFAEYLRRSKSLSTAAGGPSVAAAAAPLNGAVAAAFFKVSVQSSLRLRKEPKVDDANPNANVLAWLPNGHVVRRLAAESVGEFVPVETDVSGRSFTGFVSVKHLRPLT